MEPLQTHHWDRDFRIWYYAVGHSRLLLRSNPGNPQQTRIEILFKAVEWISIPTALRNLRITQVSDADVHATLAKHGATGLDLSFGLTLYRLNAGGFDGLVAARSMFTRSDNLDYAAASPWDVLAD